MGLIFNYDGAPAAAAIRKAVAITPHNTNALATPTKAIYCGVGGDLKVTLVAGGTVTLKNLAYGMWHPIEASVVFDTGTTATDIIGCV